MFEELIALNGFPKTCSLDEYLNFTPIYSKCLEIDEDEKIKWFVMDARAGYIIFKDENAKDRKKKIVFVKWLNDRNEAIEFCYELAKKEIEELKSKS